MQNRPSQRMNWILIVGVKSSGLIPETEERDNLASPNDCTNEFNHMRQMVEAQQKQFEFAIAYGPNQQEIVFVPVPTT